MAIFFEQYWQKPSVLDDIELIHAPLIRHMNCEIRPDKYIDDAVGVDDGGDGGDREDRENGEDGEDGGDEEDGEEGTI